MQTATASDDEDDPTTASSGERRRELTLAVVKATMTFTDLAAHLLAEAPQENAALTTVSIMRAALTLTEIALTNWQGRQR